MANQDMFKTELNCGLHELSQVNNPLNSVCQYSQSGYRQVIPAINTHAISYAVFQLKNVFRNNILNLVQSAINRFLSFFLLLAFIFLFQACKQAKHDTGPKYGTSPLSQTTPGYHFAVHPLNNPARLMKSYQPLMEYMNIKLEGAKLTLEASRDYASFEQKYKDRKVEFLLPNPWQTIQAMNSGYNVIAMAGNPNDFKGLFIVRRDGDINKPTDLKGKAVSYPSATALAACIMPQYFLHTHGVNVNNDILNRYVGSQESSIMNVYLKKTAAGATWPTPWRNFQKEFPREAMELKVIWETESLINNSVMIRNDIPEHIREQVQKYLVGLHETKQGKAILAGIETTCFLRATNQDYEVVRKYIDRFENEIRKVSAK